MATFLRHSGHGQRRGPSSCFSASSLAGERHLLFPQAAQSCCVAVSLSRALLSRYFARHFER